MSACFFCFWLREVTWLFWLVFHLATSFFLGSLFTFFGNFDTTVLRWTIFNLTPVHWVSHLLSSFFLPSVGLDPPRTRDYFGPFPISFLFFLIKTLLLEWCTSKGRGLFLYPLKSTKVAQQHFPPPPLSICTHWFFLLLFFFFISRNFSAII